MSFFARTTMPMALVAALATPALAGDLTATVDFSVVELSSDGSEMLVERAEVRPGEVIQYNMRHENVGESDVSGLVVIGPVPAGTSFVEAGASTSVSAIFEVQAEMDPEAPGLEWSTLPATRLVADETGTLREEPLPTTAVEAVRWRIADALAEGAVALNTYRVIVN